MSLTILLCFSYETYVKLRLRSKPLPLAAAFHVGTWLASSCTLLASPPSAPHLLCDILLPSTCSVADTVSRCWPTGLSKKGPSSGPWVNSVARAGGTLDGPHPVKGEEEAAQWILEEKLVRVQDASSTPSSHVSRIHLAHLFFSAFLSSLLVFLWGAWVLPPALAGRQRITPVWLVTKFEV